MLGVAARSVLHDVASASSPATRRACLRIVAAMSDQGYDITHVARDLLAVLRDLVVAKVCKEPDALLDLADEEARDVKALAAGEPTPTISCACTTASRRASTTS